VVKVDLVHGVLGRVDRLQVVLEGRLKDHGGRVASLGSRSVVGAGVAALGVDVRNIRVLSSRS
jgi:hypothetical protein